MKNKLFLAIIMTLALVLSVSAMGSINIVESSRTLSAAPGAVNNSVFFTVDNTGGDALSGIFFNVTDFTGAGTTISRSQMSFLPATVDLGAGSDYPIVMSLAIPDGQKAGSYSATVKAVYNDSNWDQLPLTVTVLSAPDFTETATTADLVQGSSGSIKINVTNTGNVDLSGLSYALDGALTSGANTLNPVSGGSGSLSVPYGSSNQIVMLFSPSGSQAAGTYSGILRLTYGSTEHLQPVTVSVHEPVKSISLADITFDESERDINVTKDVTIRNTGDVTLTGVTLSGTDDVTFTGAVPGILLPGSEFTVTVQAYVSETADSGLDNAGTLVFHSNELDKTVNVKTDAKSMLEFDFVKISIDDNSWDSVEDGDTADDDARPGDKFEVKVKLENLYDDDYSDGDMDIEIEGIFYGAGESGDDIESDTVDTDADAGEKTDEELIDFDDTYIDWDSDSGKLQMEIWAEGIDDNGVRHYASVNFTVNVERDNDGELIFTRTDALDTVECGRSLTVYLDGRNVGKDSDDDAVLRLRSDALGINEKVEFIIGSYEEDDEDCDAIKDDEDGEDCSVFEYRKSFFIPSNIGAGDYTLEAELFIKNDDQTDEETFDIEVTCSGSSSSSSSSSSTSTGSSSTGTSSSGSTSTGTTSTGTSGTTSSGSTSTPSGSSSTTSSVEVLYGGSGVTPSSSRGVMATSPTSIKDLTRKDSFADSDAYLALLSIMSVLVIVGIIILVVVMVTKPRE